MMMIDVRWQRVTGRRALRGFYHSWILCQKKTIILIAEQTKRLVASPLLSVEAAAAAASALFFINIKHLSTCLHIYRRRRRLVSSSQASNIIS